MPQMVSVVHPMIRLPWFNVVTLNGAFKFMWVKRGGELFISRGIGWWHVSKSTWDGLMQGVEYESNDEFRKKMRFFEEVDARFANAYAVHADTDVQDDDEDDEDDDADMQPDDQDDDEDEDADEGVGGCGIFV